MDDNLRIVKTNANSLAAIQSPVSDFELIQYTIAGLQHSSEDERFITTYSMLPGAHSFDDLLSKLTFFEQQIKSSKECDVSSHQAFAATIGSIISDSMLVISRSTPTLKARTMEVVPSIKGVRVILTSTIIDTTIASLSINHTLPKACPQGILLTAPIATSLTSNLCFPPIPHLILFDVGEQVWYPNFAATSHMKPDDVVIYSLNLLILDQVLLRYFQDTRSWSLSSPFC